MTTSKLAKGASVSPKRGSRLGSRIDTFLIHHMASTDGEGVTRMMWGAGGREVSANYTILNDGTLYGVVPEEDRAWTSGAAGDGGRGAAWDRRSITVEIENESAAPDWRISAAAITTAARLLNDLRARYGVTNVLGHRDLYERFGASYPTFCPGPNTVATIVAKAASLAAKPTTTTPKPAPAAPLEDDDMPIAILEKKGDSQSTKSLYNVTTGKAIRAISRDENISFRASQADGGPIVYVSVSPAEYKQRGGF